MKIISGIEDVEGLKFGDPFILSPPGFDEGDHDPIEFADAMIELKAEVLPALAAIKPEQPVLVRVVAGRFLVDVNAESALPLVVDGDAYKTTITKLGNRSIRMQKNLSGYVTLNGVRVAY